MPEAENIADAPKPFELDHTIELVRAAYMQAMREHGLLLGTRMLISASAELHIATTLEAEDSENS